MRPGGSGNGRPTGLRAERDSLVAGATTPGGLAALPARYAAAADAALGRLLDEATGGDTKGFALVAVGGYGRSELCPGSDLDVVLVHRGRRDVERVAQHVWYAVWDEGIRLDHSVRTVREALSVARSDLRAALGLLDARVVTGDPGVAGDLRSRMHELFRAQARRYLTELGETVRERHRASGEVAFLLEPDLKEAHGGLRDATGLGSAAAGMPSLAPSLGLGEIAGPVSTLLTVRVALHARTGRHADRLLLEEQDQVATMLGHGDADDLMAAVASAGREIAWASDEGWRRVRSVLAGPRGRVAGRDRDLGPGLVLRDGEMAVAPGGAPGEDPSLLLRAAAIASQDGFEFAPGVLDRLAAGSPPVPEPWPPEIRQAFLGLLGGGDRAVTVLEALDRRRVLERLIPEWSAVRNRPQRNAYHRFTVDRHLLEAVARAGDLVRRVARPDLLLVGALLHDIGKGFPGDHTVAGVARAPAIAERMGFVPADVDTVGRLVGHHLLIPDAATRRDLDDPATIEAVAAAVGDVGTLELLAALTEADSLATGPAAWGPWKAGLVADLVRRVGELLASEGGGGGPGGAAAEPLGVPPELARIASEGRTGVVTGGDRRAATVSVVAADRPGLLSIAAGVIALHGLGVRAAAVASGGPGMAIGRFEVEAVFGRPPDAALLERDLVAALEGRLPLESRLAEQARTYARSRRPSAARPAEVRVMVDNDASGRATVVEVRAPDSLGLLHVIGRTFAAEGLDVASARVTTLGHEVVDTFYVTDARAGGGKLLAGERIAGVTDALMAALGGGRAGFRGSG